MLEYEQEKFPKSLLQGPKMSISLRPSSSEHWNIDSDLILPLMIDTYQRWREAKQAEQDPDESLWELKHLQRRRLLQRRLLRLRRVQQGCIPNRDHMPG